MKDKHFLQRAIYKDNHVMFVISVIILAFSYALDVGMAWMMQELFDSVGNNGHFTLAELGMIFIAFFVVAVIAQLIFRVTKSRFARRAMLQYKQTAMNRLLGHSLNDYKITNSSTILSAMSNDIATIEANYLMGLFNIVIQAVLFMAALVMMLCYNWKLTIISIVASVLAFGVSMIFGNRVTVIEQRVSAQNDICLGTIKEIIEGFPIIKAFKTEKQIEKVYEKSNNELESAKYEKRMLVTLVQIVSQYASALAQCGIFFIGIYFAHKGYITIGVVIAFVQLMNYLLGPVQALPGLISEWRAARKLIYKLEELLSTPADNQGTYELPVKAHDISFENVHFGYEKGFFGCSQYMVYSFGIT